LKCPTPMSMLCLSEIKILFLKTASVPSCKDITSKLFLSLWIS
jgi:hypothetical protein